MDEAADRAFQAECEKKRRNGKVIAPSSNKFPGIPDQTQEVVKTVINNRFFVFETFLRRTTIKCSIAAPEWFVIVRNLRTMNPFTFIDSENKSVAFFRPYIHNGVFDVAVELQPIEIGPKFKGMLE